VWAVYCAPHCPRTRGMGGGGMLMCDGYVPPCSPHGCSNAARCLPRHVAGDGALSCAQSCRPRRPQCPKRGSAHRPARSSPCRRPPSSPGALFGRCSGRCGNCGAHVVSLPSRPLSLAGEMLAEPTTAAAHRRSRIMYSTRDLPMDRGVAVDAVAAYCSTAAAPRPASTTERPSLSAVRSSPAWV